MRSEEGRWTGKGRSQGEAQPEADGHTLQCPGRDTGVHGRGVDQSDEDDARDQR